MTTVTNKIVDQLASRLHERVPYRSDLYMADYSTISSTSARLLVGYERKLGKPKMKDVEQFILCAFEGSLLPHQETARVVVEQAAVIIAASKYVPTKALKESENMMAIASTMFIDQVLQETWEVRSTGEGNKYLARVSPENIDSILQERRSRMKTHARHVTFAEIGTGLPEVTPGAIVKFIADSEVMTGKVSVVAPSTVTVIEQKTGNAFTINKYSVVDIVEWSSEMKNEMLNDIKDHYSKVYSPDYAADMARQAGGE